MTDTTASSMVNQPNTNAPLPRAVTVARIWLLVLGCAWFLAGFVVGSGTADGSRWWGMLLVAVGLVHFAVARYVKSRPALFLALFGP
jgi:hypothetical protein